MDWGKDARRVHGRDGGEEAKRRAEGNPRGGGGDGAQTGMHLEKINNKKCIVFAAGRCTRKGGRARRGQGGGKPGCEPDRHSNLKRTMHQRPATIQNGIPSHTP
jgi:hypothetical protein